MTAKHGFFAAAAVLGLVHASSAHADVMRCPERVWSPPHAGMPGDNRANPGWQALWRDNWGSLTFLAIYFAPDVPEGDLKPVWYPAIGHQESYNDQSANPWLKFETKSKVGRYLILYTDDIWMECRYENMSFALYRKLEAPASRCEAYRKKDKKGRPTGPLIGECR